MRYISYSGCSYIRKCLIAIIFNFPLEYVTKNVQENLERLKLNGLCASFCLVLMLIGCKQISAKNTHALLVAG